MEMRGRRSGVVRAAVVVAVVGGRDTVVEVLERIVGRVGARREMGLIGEVSVVVLGESKV